MCYPGRACRCLRSFSDAEARHIVAVSRVLQHMDTLPYSSHHDQTLSGRARAGAVSTTRVPVHLLVSRYYFCLPRVGPRKVSK